MPKKPPFPFMVFHEAFDLPDGRNRITLLNDPNTPADVKDAIRRDFKASLETAEQMAKRDTQRARHAKNHELRDRVMADLRRDLRGRPLRGEPKRVAALHDVPVLRVRKWIEQLRGKPLPPSSSARQKRGLADWRTVYYGEALRAQNRSAARHPKKSKT
jgi:hypothetical protein